MLDEIDPRLKNISRTYPSAEMKVIVETSEDPKSLESLVSSRNGRFLGQGLRYAAVKIQAGRLKELAKEAKVEKIWYVNPGIFDPYFNLLKAAQYILSMKAERASIVNMSLGPPIERPGTLSFDPDEPVNVATKRLYEAGMTVVIAVGNYGRLGNDTLNPWSVAPWVIGVGAATKNGKKLADFSSRGRPGDQLYRPTVVGPGIDRVTTHPPDIKKTPEQLAKDRQFISEDKLDHYIVVSGTSMAAADVSGAIANIMGYMEEHMNLGHTQRVITLSIGGCYKILRFKVSKHPWNIKDFVMKLAIPMQGYQPHEVGAGFISRAITEQCFGDYASKTELASIKIL